MKPADIRNEIIAHVIDLEAGYVNNPDDSGGPTNHGITEKVARADGYTGRMEDLPVERAIRIYERKYYRPLYLDYIAPLSRPIAKELMDTGVNMSTHLAATFLQRVLNVSNNKGTHYRDLIVDGSIGGKTLTALRAYLARRGRPGEKNMVKALDCLQGAFYITLAENREKDETFFYGWLDKRIG